MTRVAATGQQLDPDGGRLPAGEVHAWLPGRNSTVCGLQLSRSGLVRFPGVPWPDVMPSSGRSADAVASVCPRCAAAEGGDHTDRRPWQRRGVPRRP